eukprot:TRINITY_DN2334_c0_g1_i1.p2 TRINITY_DN2334_c0_g1~~TRINITY_DN2334_c0_g1_i1.p2  ORF type:complete len:164 (+),score=49.55 TRINITY_DN2334_c0_g1_i1:75-494(+)
MGKSKKGFAKANGRKKARLARLDTKKKKIKSRREERLVLKDGPVKMMDNLDIKDDEQKREDDDWSDIGTITTNGGLRLSKVEKKRSAPLTRKQIDKKTFKIARGISYSQRLTKEMREAMAKRLKRKIEGKEYRAEVRAA